LSQDYSQTLNLPKTNFPMRANLSRNEPSILDFWDRINLYNIMRNKSEDRFVLHDGPPFANGKIHIGHCLNKVLKDIILKYNSIIGKGIDYIPGWDCHGLPIEHQVSRKIKNKNMPKVEIRNMCEEFALSFVESQKEEFKRLGVIADWSNSYLTIDPGFEANQIGVFWDMYSKGFIYRGLKPVHWSPSSRTALAEAELDYPENHISKSIYVKFRIKEETVSISSIKKLNKPLFLMIWTTTPWTLPANEAVSVNKDFKYGIYQTDEEYWMIEKELSQKIDEKIDKEFTLVLEVDGADLLNFRYISPISNKDAPIVHADYVTRESGTGLVHIAPGHGTDDYNTGTKNRLKVFSPVDEAGRFTEEAGPELNGLNVLSDGNDKVIELIKKKNLLVLSEDYNHQYPYDWRTGKPTIFRATHQWFASVDKFRNLALEEISKVKWYPERVINRISKMIQDRSDWCISRQRSWGLPIPVFYYKDGGDVFINEDTIKKIVDIFKKQGSSAWWELEIKDLLPDKYKDQAIDLVKGEDTLDVWFDSGSSWKTVLLRDNHYPADLYLEGNDQHRGWFQSSLLTSVANHSIAPYKAVLTHGFVVDGKGQKMSKSKGNVFDPERIIKQHGADILRLWVASEDYSSEVRISDEILSSITDKYKKIRNTLRFLLGNMYDIDDKKFIDFDQLQEIDKWILIRFSDIKKKYIQSFDSYLFHLGTNEIVNFCANDLSSIYLDVQKDVLYTYSKNSQERISAQTSIFLIFKELCLMLAPILSFTVEEAWKESFGSKDTIFVGELSNDIFEDLKIRSSWKKILSLRDEVLREIETKRKMKVLGNSLEAKVHLKCNSSQFDFLSDNLELIKRVLIVSELSVSNSKKNDLDIVVEKTKNKKCQRCWMHYSRKDFSKSDKNICMRCEQQLKI